MNAIRYIFLSVLLGVVGQLLLKRGMTALGPITLRQSNIFSTIFTVFSQPIVILGASIYLIGSFFWLVSLSKVDLSYAYPFVSLSYVLILISSWLLLNEQISPLRVAGVVVICLGVFLISRS